MNFGDCQMNRPGMRWRGAHVLLGAFFILNSSFLIPHSPAVEVDGIAARVGSSVILRSDVENEQQRMPPQMRATFSETLNQLIDRKLILAAAAESKMTMQEWVVENRIREIINRSFGGDRNRLIESLARQRVSYPEWAAKVKEDLIVGAMRWNVVDKNVTASPAAMRREYEANRSKYAKDHKVSVSVIMLKPEEAAKRDEIAAALKTKSFEDLGGRKYADVEPNDQFNPEIVKAIEALPKGSVSKWIDLDGWSFLIRKDDESAGQEMSFADAYDAVEANVKEEEAKRLYKAWVARLRAETYIKVF